LCLVLWVELFLPPFNRLGGGRSCPPACFVVEISPPSISLHVSLSTISSLPSKSLPLRVFGLRWDFSDASHVHCLSSSWWFSLISPCYKTRPPRIFLFGVFFVFFFGCWVFFWRVVFVGSFFFLGVFWFWGVVGFGWVFFWFFSCWFLVFGGCFCIMSEIPPLWTFGNFFFRVPSLCRWLSPLLSEDP